jgi:cyclin K
MPVQGKGNRCSGHSRKWPSTCLRYLLRNMLEMDLFFSFTCFSQEIDEVSSQILAAEEVLLEALCFDFVIDSPHADLVDLFDAHDVAYRFQDYAWSIAHDSSVLFHPPYPGCVLAVIHLIFRYRTPLCVLYPPKIIATACYILAQRIVDGPHSLSLDARVSPSAPSASLPTPPTHKPSSPDASRFAIEFIGLKESELLSVAGTYVVALRLLTLGEFTS